MTIKVRAIAKGFYGGRVREAGDVFEVNAKQDIGSWMDPAVEERKPAKGGKKSEGEKPEGEQDLA